MECKYFDNYFMNNKIRIHKMHLKLRIKHDMYTLSGFSKARRICWPLGPPHRVQLMKESGILPKWVDEQTSNTSQCLLPPSSDVTNSIEALNMEDLAGPFLILVAGEKMSYYEGDMNGARLIDLVFVFWISIMSSSPTGLIVSSIIFLFESAPCWSRSGNSEQP